MTRFAQGILISAYYVASMVGWMSLLALVVLLDHRWMNLLPAGLLGLATGVFSWYVLRRDQWRTGTLPDHIVRRLPVIPMALPPELDNRFERHLLDDISLEGVTPGPWVATSFARAPGDAKSPPLNTWKIRSIQKTALGSMSEADARFIVEVRNRLEQARGTV